jgi:hypothetical protein
MLHLYGMILTEAVQDIIQEKYQALRPELDERGRRIWAAVTKSSRSGLGKFFLPIEWWARKRPCPPYMSELLVSISIGCL